jgi:transposase
VSGTEQNKGKIIAQQCDKILMLESEITFLKESVFQLKKMIFGSQSEKFDANQEELNLGLNEIVIESVENDDDPDKPENIIPIKKKKRNNRRTHISENLRTTVEIIRPDEVNANPEKYRQVGMDEKKSIHYRQSEFHQTIQQFPKYVLIKEDEDAEQKAFLQAKRPPCLLEKSVLTPSLLAHIITSKFHDHLPFDRQSKIMKRRHDVIFPANTLCNWANVAAETLQPLYNIIGEDIADSKQINIDETPVRYIKRKNGQEEVSSKGSKDGFFWVYQSDTAGVLYDWATDRKIGSLQKILNKGGREHIGFIQSDGFVIYDNFAAESKGVTLGGCWVHARRYFVKAADGKEVTPATRDAKLILQYIRKLYQNESKFKEWIEQSDHPLEAIVYYRRRYNRELIKELRAKLHEFKPQHLPKSNMGKALTYALNQWEKLCRTNKYSITLDNNRAENAVRPLKLGAKNWLFIGREDTGWRSAVIFTMIENVRILGYDPYEYLEWVFGQLPGMSNQDDLRPLLPKAWVEEKERQKVLAEKDRQQDQKESLAS